MSIRSPQKQMSYFLPDEVLIEIFVRLPLKTILQLRCVCKIWSSLISSSSSLILAHLNRSKASASDEDPPFLVRHFTNSERHTTEHYLLLKDNDQTLGERSVELDFPFKSRSNYHFRIVGSCNGLICLSDDYSIHAGDIILWNPSIRKSVTLPRPRVTEITHGSITFLLGFGYDCKTDDYKVVRVAYVKGRTGRDLIPPEVEVYSLNSRKWRSFDTGSPAYGMFGYTWSQAFLNGIVHWVGYDPCVAGPNNSLIVSFDMGDEVFREVMLPDSLAAHGDENLAVSVYREKLLVVHYYYRSKRQCCSIWFQNEYGVVDSWTKLYDIGIQGGIQRVLGFRKNEEVLLATTRGKLKTYDPKTEQFTSVGIRGAMDSFFVSPYLESLVLIGVESSDVQESSCDDIDYQGAEGSGFEDRRWPGVYEEERMTRFSKFAHGRDLEPELSSGRYYAETGTSDGFGDGCEEWDNALAAKVQVRS